MSMLAKQDILIDSKMQSQRFKIANNKLKIINLKQFVLDLVKHSTIYAIVCASVTKAPNKKLAKSKVPKKLRDLKDVYDDKLAKILLELRREDHVIKLQNDKEPPFMSLYNLSQNELTILRQYLDDALVKDQIKHSILLANASILFVSKSNDELRLCVNYRNLNAITIKNRYSLPLITKTLDRLCEAKRFIALNLKDVYHRIRIKRDDK